MAILHARPEVQQLPNEGRNTIIGAVFIFLGAAFWLSIGAMILAGARGMFEMEPYGIFPIAWSAAAVSFYLAVSVLAVSTLFGWLA